MKMMIMVVVVLVVWTAAAGQVGSKQPTALGLLGPGVILTFSVGAFSVFGALPLLVLLRFQTVSCSFAPGPLWNCFLDVSSCLCARSSSPQRECPNKYGYLSHFLCFVMKDSRVSLGLSLMIWQ